MSKKLLKHAFEVLCEELPVPRQVVGAEAAHLQLAARRLLLFFNDDLERRQNSLDKIAEPAKKIFRSDDLLVLDGRSKLLLLSPARI